MGSKARWFAAVVLVLGCLSLAIAAWIHVNEINEWAPSFVQFGLMLIVPAVVALYEQRWGSLSYPALMAVLWLPAAVVVGAGLLGATVDPVVVFGNLNGIEALFYHAPIVFVPLVYVLGRARTKRVQWLLAGVLALAFVGVLAYFTVATLDRPFRNPLKPVVGITSIAVSLAIPLYHLGRIVGSPPEPASLYRHPPALLGAVVVIVLPIAFALLGDGPIPVRENGVMWILVYAPVAYVVLRGAQAVSRRQQAPTA